VKELSGTAAAPVGVPVAQCIELLASLERYPEWYPDVIVRAEVLERDRAAAPTRAAATVRVSVGPLSKDFDLLLDVDVHANGLRLERIPNEPTDPERLRLEWVATRNRTTRLEVVLFACLEVPWFIPIGDYGDSLAQGFVEAARRVLEDPTPNASASNS
jgi:hypothetical protein